MLMKVKCDVCPESFWTGQSHAKYCSDACRQEAWRRRHGLPFYEDLIRMCLDYHHPTGDTQHGEPLCSCSTKVGLEGCQEFTTDHFMERLIKLKEITRGRKTSIKANLAQWGSRDAPPT